MSSKKAALSYITDYRDNLLAQVVDDVTVRAYNLVKARERLEMARGKADPQVQEERWEELHRCIGHLAGAMLSSEQIIALSSLIEKLNNGEQKNDEH